MASPNFMYIPGTFYKIADGPLDIRTQQIQVLVNGSTNPKTIEPGYWEDISTVDSGSVISGSLYLVGISTGYMASEHIFVCDNAVLNDYAMNFGGEMPFTGIFVSEGVESITVPGHEVIHKIDSKYTESILSIILEHSDDGDTFVQKNGGYIYLRMGANPLSVTLKLSTGEPCSYIEVIPITSTAMEAESHAWIELQDESTGECIITPPDYDGSHSRIVDTYLLTYFSREQVDGKYVGTSFYLVIDSERVA